MENSSDTIGNRTRDIPPCSAVPQQIAPPRVSGIYYVLLKILIPVFFKYNFSFS